MEKGGCVYIMANKNNSTVYTGVTSDLFTRVTEHKQRLHKGSFTDRYNLSKLVYFESFHSIEEAIAREKQIKAGSRKKKDQLIASKNPNWIDLYNEISQW
ncbi:MAG: GIY-YIG nuclease family protein [Ekhidna sp.]